MNRALVVFAALAGTPLAAFVSRPASLYMFALFPVVGLATGGAAYARRLAALTLPPAASLCWALLDSPEAVIPSLRWIAAAACGTYFAWVLGTGGAALVLRGVIERVPFLRRPLDPVVVTLQLAGPCAALTRLAWSETRGRGSVFDRMALVAGRVLNEALPEERSVEISALATVTAGLGWAMLSLSVAGFL